MKSAQDGWKAQRVQLESLRDELKERLAELGFKDLARVRQEDKDGLATSLLETHAELEHALGKMRAGTYGRCERCQQQIAPARLAAMPAARFCIACAARAEAREDATAQFDARVGIGDADADGGTAQFDVRGVTGDPEADGATAQFDLRGGAGDVETDGATAQFDLRGSAGEAETDGATAQFDLHGTAGDSDTDGATSQFEVDGATTEEEVDGATQLGIPAFAGADDDSEEHTVQTKVPADVKEGGMKVWVDNELCSGTGQCVQLCPEVFTIVDGLVRVKDGGKVIPGGPDGLASVPAAHEETVIAAADGCPSQCIFIEVG